MADAYRVLNVSPTAPASAIRSAYLELACQHHPCKLSDGQDINPSANHTQFRLAAEAYALVGDDSRRELYDLIKSSDFFRTGAGRYVQEENGATVGKERQGLPAGRSRARSELTVDLRAGLPAELRAFLMDLDPVKVFNRVVCQIDQERRAQQVPAAEHPASSSSSRLKPTNHHHSILPQSKYLSPPSHYLDERLFSRAGHGKPSASGAVREDGGPGKQQLVVNGALKTGILRDESKSQFRRSPSGQGALLSEPYNQRLAAGSELAWDSRRDPGHSRTASSYNSSSSAGARHGSGRRVSFSNDVIESDQIKQAREAVKSFKSEAARNAPKPIFTNPASPPHSLSLEVSNNSTARALVNKLGSLTLQGGMMTSPSSSYTKASEFLLSDKSLYSGSRSTIDASAHQDGSIKPMMGLGGSGRDSHRTPTTAGHSSASSSSQHALNGRNISASRGDRPYAFLATSAPTGFLARYRLDQDLLRDKLPILPPTSTTNHQYHHLPLPNPPPRLDHIDHSFPWSDPNFDNPRSILLNHTTTREVN